MSETLDLSKVSKRDKALVTILEYMVKQLQVQDAMIKDLIDRHDKVSGTIDDSVFQSNLTRDELDNGLKKLHDTFSRYRSDMLSVVHEQDIIRTGVDSTLENVKNIAYSVENTGQVMLNIETELDKQYNALYENIIFTNSQWENQPSEFFGIRRNIGELHANIESYFDRLRTENEAHFKKLQSETTRRLLVLDEMMSALDTLLIRTTPPEKKPFIFIRIFKIIGRFLKKTAKAFLERIGSFFKKNKDE